MTSERERAAHLDATRRYYDEFSSRYEDHRGGRDAGGYHDLVDDLEVDFVKRFAKGKHLLEVGCGTGLLLERFARFAEHATGIDLSPGMLARARERGLDVTEASATSLPFANASFDVTCSFKVLPHVRELDVALREMTRVTRPGGIVIAEFYNPRSFRGLAKRFGPAGFVGERTRESDVFTRFHTPREAEAVVLAAAGPGARVVATRGVRIVTVAAKAMRVPQLGRALRRAEWLLADTPAKRLAGFYVVAVAKR